MGRTWIALSVFSVLWIAAESQARVLQEPQNRGQVRIEKYVTLKDGWWVRVNPSTTTATAIDWQVGATSDELTLKDSWRRDGVAERFFLNLGDTNLIHIKATATPPGASASFCIFRREEGIALVEFTGTADRQFTASQAESRCAS